MMYTTDTEFLFQLMRIPALFCCPSDRTLDILSVTNLTKMMSPLICEFCNEWRPAFVAGASRAQGTLKR